MSPYVYAGTFLATVALGMCAPSWFRARRYAKAETAFWRSLTTYVDRARADIDQATTNHIDARIEAALLEGVQAPDAEVTRRIRAHMDAACHKLRDDIDEWESA